MEKENERVKYYILEEWGYDDYQGIPYFVVQRDKKLYTKEEKEQKKPELQHAYSISSRWEEVEVEKQDLENNRNLYLNNHFLLEDVIEYDKLYTQDKINELEKQGKFSGNDKSLLWEYKTPEREKEINEQLEKMEAKLRETKTVVTHFGDDLDNKASIYYLEQWARAKGILEENENLTIERVGAGEIKEGMLNVDTGGHTGSRIDGDTIVIDGDPANGIHSAIAELADMIIEDVYLDANHFNPVQIPSQIVELADVVPNKVNPLESRTALSLIRSATGEQIFEMANAGLLDKALTDEQLEKYGLVEAQKNQQTIIDNAVEKVNKYTKELATGEKVVIAPEQILAGSAIAYELGANYYVSVQAHKSGKGSTFAVNSKPGVKLPEPIRKFGEELVEQYKNEDGTSGVFLNPNGQMLVAGGQKNPDFAVAIEAAELIEKLNEKFKEYEVSAIKDSNLQLTPQQIVDEIEPTRGDVEGVISETSELAKQNEKDKKNKEGQTQGEE